MYICGRYCFVYGQEPTCEDLTQVPACAACAKPACKTAEQFEAMGTASSMPLSKAGLSMLDAAIAHCAASNLPAPKLTRASDTAALVALWAAMGKPAVMIDWGVSDPCAGVATTPNNAGFAFWKGVACRPCSDDPTLFCVRSIWLHQKTLVGQLPAGFRDLVDLEILLLSANNVTGHLPTGLLNSFPSLTLLDLSYNMIEGEAPLADLAGLRRLKRVNFGNSAFAPSNPCIRHSICFRPQILHPSDPGPNPHTTDHFDSISQPSEPFHGGFDSLLYFNINYNRNMSGPFPAAFGAMPKLQHLSTHDTNLTGKLPTHPRAFTSVDTLLVSGSSICGDAPPSCFRPVAGQEDSAFCDVIEGGKSVLPACSAEDSAIGGGSPMPKIRLGAPARQYSNEQ